MKAIKLFFQLLVIGVITTLFLSFFVIHGDGPRIKIEVKRDTLILVPIEALILGDHLMLTYDEINWQEFDTILIKNASKD
jgi:hypothetical protein